MKNKKLPYFILASTLALMMLIFIQAKWMMQSRDLIEEQFDNKVSLALCSAVEEMSKTDIAKPVLATCSSPTVPGSMCCTENLTLFADNPDMENHVKEALSFYEIDMDFVISVEDKTKEWVVLPALENDLKNYSCNLNPLNAEEHYLQISFPGKTKYILEQMGFMLILSILFILFIIGTFIYGNYLLVRQQRVAERNKEFFNHMAHEFKTPLTNIGLATKMLQKKNQDPLLKIVDQENNHLKEQVERVLSMASLENGNFDLAKKKVELGNLTQDVLDKLGIQLKAKGANVLFEKPDAPILVMADSFHLSNALRNLIENAIKYNDKIPEITIKISSLPHSAKFQIIDNGIGINKEDQEVVFEKFYRVQKDDLYETKGFGLGLSYVKKIIDLHQGAIQVMSELHQGTKFDITLPLVKKAS